MNKRFNLILATLSGFIAGYLTCAILPPRSATQPASAAQSNKQIIMSDPDRPYFDMWGNEFDAYGKLIKAAKCSVDPISHKANPYSCKKTRTVAPKQSVKPNGRCQ